MLVAWLVAVPVSTSGNVGVKSGTVFTLLVVVPLLVVGIVDTILEVGVVDTILEVDKIDVAITLPGAGKESTGPLIWIAGPTTTVTALEAPVAAAFVNPQTPPRKSVVSVVHV